MLNQTTERKSRYGPLIGTRTDGVDNIAGPDATAIVEGPETVRLWPESANHSPWGMPNKTVKASDFNAASRRASGRSDGRRQRVKRCGKECGAWFMTCREWSWRYPSNKPHHAAVAAVFEGVAGCPRSLPQPLPLLRRRLAVHRLSRKRREARPARSRSPATDRLRLDWWPRCLAPIAAQEKRRPVARRQHCRSRAILLDIDGAH